MKQLLPILFILFLVSCDINKSPKFITEEELQDSSSQINVAELVSLKKAKTYRFYIPAMYTWDIKGKGIDTTLSQNYLSLQDGDFEAKFYRNEAGQEFLAINNSIATEKCIKYFSLILQENENNYPVDTFNSIFPDLSAYSFYDFGDKRLSQLEGDEQTIFAGYHLDLSKQDSLGVQFMFCNQNNSVNTDFLNENGIIIYKNLIEL